MDVNEMIDRYVNEIGEHLPRKSRMDIEMELRSLLQDALDEQSDGQPTPKITAAMLREFGSPKEIAARYRPDEVLIGSQLFPIYRQIITIVLSIMGVLHLLGLGIALWQNNTSIVDNVLNAAFDFGSSAFISVGVITMIFAAIERLAGDSLEIPEQKSKEWDPYELPPVKDPDRINRGELIVEIVITLIFIGWLNTSTGWFNGALVSEPDAGIFALISPEFLQFIPWLTAMWLMDVVLNTAVLIQGRWHRITRWLELGVQAFSLYVFYQIFQSEAIFTIPFFNSMARWVVGIILVIVVLDMVSKVARLVFGRPFTPQSIFKSKLA